MTAIIKYKHTSQITVEFCFAGLVLQEVNLVSWVLEGKLFNSNKALLRINFQTSTAEDASIAFSRRDTFFQLVRV